MTTPQPIRVLALDPWQTPAWVAINKPPGLLSVPGKTIADCAVERVRAHFPHATGPLTVHRLDMETSGILLVALTPESQRALSAQFERRETNKRYIALVHGTPKPHDVSDNNRADIDWNEIRLPIRPDIDHRPRQIIDPIHGKESITLWRTIGEESSFGSPHTRLELRPITGRSHQLRVHCAFARDALSDMPNTEHWSPGGLGTPIVGDRLYNPADPAPRLHLHATRLEFTDPTTTERVTIESPPDF
ncbi:MAG: RluA family pseudouridine synthase [Phycisphaerales bacterium]|nr:MAG: RluA family pseudouridine synthase [Phycisphaerales bacterium]